jgi:ankyrin repeat protein
MFPLPCEKEMDYKKENHPSHLLVRLLVKDLDVSPNYPDEYGNYPLHYAVREGNQDVIDALVDCGALWCVYDAKGKTPYDDVE